MQKVSFFRSIHFKFILIYVLLITVAMQVIGVYFVDKLEEQFVTNFSKSLRERISLLAYNVDQVLDQPRNDTTQTLEDDIYQLLRKNDLFSDDLIEAQVINSNKFVIGTTNPANQHIVGRISTEVRVKKALVSGGTFSDVLRHPKLGHRIQVLAVPINNKNGQTVGAIYVEASMEDIYEQMQEINNILATSTIIALAITALLGVFLARTITKPMSEMRKHALTMAKGDFTKQVKVYGEDEIGHLAIAFNDLTSNLKEARENTEDERRKLISVLTHMTDGVIAANQKGEIILMNTRAEKMLGIPYEKAQGKSVLHLLKLEGIMTLRDLYGYYGEFLIDLSTDYKKYYLKANISLIKTEEKDFSGIIVVLHDVTEQEQIEQERREFVATVSHELRTPLTTMRSYLEALSDGALEDENLAPQFIKVTQDETERMIRLVKDLLQLSKIDSQEFKINESTVEMLEYMTLIVDRFEMTKGHQFVFTKVFPKHELNMIIDSDKMTQVFDNILSNAIKYSPEGGEILINMALQNEGLIIEISDKGVGIPADSVEKIFDRFYRVDKARSRKLGGTGLGLAIAKEIIREHQGEIWATSKEGKGTTIHIKLPIARYKGGAMK
ncbi:cell wall metabolism sensor histidine kinase WalK [Lottiidibacillus patelloidae]|uniref:histidine kinase n=1 Tax=Lottiidibacillus patelloidae TaxID=2670334 RepID=A0A263BS92_9BACI|nr:cell wall metabolism sensor histidine kinase WalK [Lottiidibacillus patelloidae]OZM56591.1 cell wall metabolism sensor histidine kinase WalK [Lottiidibacillus patelloidae]